MFFGEKAPTQEPGVGASPLERATAGRIPSHDVVSSVLEQSHEHVFFPPGLIGQIASYILDAAQHQSRTIALAGAIGLLSGVTGRSYNTYTGAGLNQYILVLAKTGMGKDIIAKSISTLVANVAKYVEGATAFKGPGELVSSAGLIKWLAKNPAVFSILGEFGVKLKEMADPRANAHLAGLERVLLQLYSKSDYGNVFDPIAYSDVDKNTKPIAHPSFTLLCEAEPVRFYEMLNPAMIASGLLPRFCLFEETGKRPYAQDCPRLLPSAELVNDLAQLMANCLAIPGRQVGIYVVPASAEAEDLFRQFERFATDQINAAGSEVNRQLWNRARLKALKLATLCAVGINPFNPVVTIDEANWATHLIARQTNALIGKFDAGEVGQLAHDEDRQVVEVIKAITLYVNEDHSRVKPYDVDEAMHSAKVFTKSFLYRYVSKRAAFRSDRQGANNALERVLKVLTESDEIREVPKGQMNQSFGSGPRGYCIANATRFLPTTPT